MTHDELVARALRWVRRTHRLAAVEVPGAQESPDVIGFRYMGTDSILVECKTSRKDFLKDTKKKVFRQEARLGMGAARWYFAPTGVIYPHELPEGWGLACVKGARVRVLKESARFPERNREAEMVMLFVMAQRATEGWGRKIFGDAAPPSTDGDPSPTTFGLLKKLRRELKEERDTKAALTKQIIDLAGTVGSLRSQLYEFTGEGLP